MWKGYTEKLSEREMSEIYGSKFLFLFEMHQLIRLYYNEDNKIYEKLLLEMKLKSIDEKLRNELSIFIFGVGAWGLKIYNLLKIIGVKISYFIDNNPQKQGIEIIDGIFCKSVAECIASKDEILVIVAIADNFPVLTQLNNLGFQHVLAKQQFLSIFEDINENKVELLEFRLGYSERGYTEFCKRCSGYHNNPYKIKAAEQL